MRKMVFLNIGWMTRYQGLEDDSISGGGSYVDEYHDGCEIRNFEPYEGCMYGFVRIHGSLNINRLGASSKDDSVDGVLVVWVATSPTRGPVIVGWFENATVYRCRQHPPEGSGRERPGRHEWGYRVKARAEDCKLLPVERRVFRIPRGRGGMGQTNVWYADQAGNEALRQRVRDFITLQRAGSG